jgi:hypothetical protein
MRACILWILLLAAPLLGAFDDHPHPMRKAEADRKAAAADALRSGAFRETLDPNQEQYDTRFLDLDIAFDTAQASVDGSIRIRVTVSGDAISTLVLDLDDALTVDGVGLAAVTHSHVGDLLTLTLDRAYTPGEDLEVQVDWSGVPNSNLGAFGFDTADGKPLIWSLSEPFGARTWFPVKDTPSDKADSASIKFTVPEPMIAVSNGTLEQVVDLGTTRRFEWMERHPIAIYLISIAAHDYVEQSRAVATNAGPLPLVNWSYASDAGAALANLDLTEQMMLDFEQMFGPYPFMDEKYGQAQFNWGGGMEHQTATSLCCWGIEFLIAHELGHQWFGDQVTCDSFTEIWVNEGFATYSEALWQEASNGAEAYRNEMRAARYFGPGTIRVPESDLGNTSRIFSSGLSYNKASWVVHMLRWVLGDSDFFEFLKAYLNDPALTYGTARTEDVQRVAEQVSGKDLQAFFDQWIDTEYYPTYSLLWGKSAQPGSWDLSLELAQLQSHHVYSMPVPVRVTTTNGTVDFVIDSNEPVEQVVLPLADEPIAVELDPDDWVLHAEEASIASPTFDRGILLVNGVDIDVYGSEIRNVLNDSICTGQQPFEFWNLFPAPAGGYPSGLPAARGEGTIAAEILGEYSTVVWLGNDYNGDTGAWIDAAILDYMLKGGNVVLLSRRGTSFLTQTRLQYLGTDFAAIDQTLGNASATFAGLVDMTRTGTQSYCAPLDPTPLQPETTLLFSDGLNPAWATGLWRQPVGGGSLRSGGGHFVHLAGRPYRWEPTALRANMEFILSQIIGEPEIPTATSPVRALRHGLTGLSPNPFNPRVRIDFSLDRPGPVELVVFDLRGRRVRTLLHESRPAGEDAVVWDGTDDSGGSVASGVYTIQFRAAGRADHGKVTLVR